MIIPTNILSRTPKSPFAQFQQTHETQHRTLFLEQRRSVANKITETISSDDYVVIVQDGCVKEISYQDFISGVFLGGFSICQSWLNCVEGIGEFEDPIPDEDHKPVMQNIILSINNRTQNILVGDDFINAYYDEDGDEFGKIIITSGDVSGFNIAGVPLYIGQVIPANQVALIEYDGKDVDSSYNQEWFFETYDVNNVKAQ